MNVNANQKLIIIVDNISCNKNEYESKDQLKMNANG